MQGSGPLRSLQVVAKIGKCAVWVQCKQGSGYRIMMSMEEGHARGRSSAPGLKTYSCKPPSPPLGDPFRASGAQSRCACEFVRIMLHGRRIRSIASIGCDAGA